MKQALIGGLGCGAARVTSLLGLGLITLGDTSAGPRRRRGPVLVDDL